MKSAGPKMIVSMRSLANAMSLTLIRPCAVSICASMPIRPTSRPLAFSIWVSSMSSALTWAASCTFGSMMQSRFAPAPPTTSSTSWKVHSVVQSLTRTVRILSPQPPSFSAATMFLRAPGLASGAQASSRSRKTWSAGRPFAFSRNRGLLPGTARLERRDRSSATVPPLSCRRWLPEGSDGDLPARPELIIAACRPQSRRGRHAHSRSRRRSTRVGAQVAGSTSVVGRLARTTSATPATTSATPGSASSGGTWPQQHEREQQRPRHLQQDGEAHHRRPDRREHQVEQRVPEQLGADGDRRRSATSRAR